MASRHRFFQAAAIVRTVAAVVALALVLAPAAARAQDAEPGPEMPLADSMPPLTPPPPPEELASARTALNAALDALEELGADASMDPVMEQAQQTRSELAGMADAQLAPIVRDIQAIRQLEQAVRDLKGILASSGGGGRSHSAGGQAGGIASKGSGGRAASKTAGFPDAEYSASCGNPNLDATALHAAYLVFEVAKLVKDIALDGCNQVEVAIFGGNVRLACTITDGIFSAAEIVFDFLMFCDDDAAIKRAKAVFLRTEHIHGDLESMASDIAFIREAVTCRPVIPLRRGSGCNGSDDDCDMPKKIDECDEDVFGPSVYIPASVGVPWYRNAAEAVAAVNAAVVAVDDCQRVTVNQATLSGTCGVVTASVTAIDACLNSTTATLTIRIDGVPPQVIIPPSLAGTCYPDVKTAEATIRNATLVSDDCTPLSELNVRVDSSVDDCTLRVRIEARNLAGMRTVDAVTVRVDAHPPVIDIDSSVSIPWYSSVGEAIANVQRATHVTDSCERVTVDAPVLLGTCGSVIATVNAQDTCGNRVSAQIVVHVDAAPPVVTIPASVANACYASVEAAEQAVRAQASISDDCTAPQDLEVRLDSSVSECQLRVRIQAVDMAGYLASAATTVRVDATPPVTRIDRLALGFSGTPLGFQSPRCYRTVADAQAAVQAATSVTDGCSGPNATTLTTSTTGTPCSLVVTARGADACGQFSTDKVTLRVDSAPPTVSCAVVTNRLAPADKRMVDVGFSFSASDGCDMALMSSINVTTDESTWGDGLSPAPDAEILRDGSGVLRGVRLRAECNVPGDGRVYKITIKSTDSCGNQGSSSCTVTVPTTTSLMVDSGQYYDASAVN